MTEVGKRLAHTLDALWQLRMKSVGLAAKCKSEEKKPEVAEPGSPKNKRSPSPKKNDVATTSSYKLRSTSSRSAKYRLRSAMHKSMEESESIGRIEAPRRLMVVASNLMPPTDDDVLGDILEDEDRTLHDLKQSGHPSMGQEPNELLEQGSYSGATSSAPQYVTEFSPGLEYPLNSNPSSYNYGQETTYPTYYQYSSSVHSPSHAYLLSTQGPQSPAMSVDDDGSIGQHARASPATIQWLLANYETADGTSLPRCTLYDHYKKHCDDSSLEPVNAASFGKLIRSVFLGLKTRRLGTRGNSKYHYYGIRIKQESPLNRGHSINDRRYSPYSPEPPVTPKPALRRILPAPPKESYQNNVVPPNLIAAPTASYDSHNTSPKQYVPEPPPSRQGSTSSNSTRQETPTQQGQTKPSDQDFSSLGNAEAPYIQLPAPESIEEGLRKMGLEFPHFYKFCEAYNENMRAAMHHVKELNFDAIEATWSAFWQSGTDDFDDEISPSPAPAGQLNRQQMFSMCTIPCVQQYIITVDLEYYQRFVEILVPSLLMSNTTPFLIQHCRNFAKNAEGYLRKAMHGAPDQIVKKKILAVKCLSQGLRRSTSLNHLATAARAVLTKPDQVEAMHNDYIRIDMALVQEQAGWATGCDPLLVEQIHESFRLLLERKADMEGWADWLESIVDQVLARYLDQPAAYISKYGKQFLVHWSFYTSMLIRDLTLRSAGSFGSFHLLRLLTDEYMNFLVEARISKAARRPPICVVCLNKEIAATSDDIALPRDSYVNNDLFNDKYLISEHEQIIEGQVVLGEMSDADVDSDDIIDMESGIKMNYNM